MAKQVRMRPGKMKSSVMAKAQSQYAKEGHCNNSTGMVWNPNAFANGKKRKKKSY